MDAAGEGLLHLYTGDGKGKSTAAAGLALRMAGHGLPVFYAQFLKSAPSGEVLAFSRYGDVVAVRRIGMRHKAFLWNQTERERLETAADIRNGWEDWRLQLKNPGWRLYVFDELLDVLEMGFLSVEQIVEDLSARHARAEVVLTGRKAPAALMDMASYATEMTLRKHPFDQGVNARKGVEW